MKPLFLTYLPAGASIIASLIISTATWAEEMETGQFSLKEAPFIPALDTDIALPKGTTLSLKDKAILSKITPKQFNLLQEGKDPASIETVDGRTVDELIAAKLGDSTDELVFTPISPCRVIDTGGDNKFAADETRSFTLSGKTDFSEFGGSNGECSLPGDKGFLVFDRIVRAWAVNIIAAAPDGGGNFQVWPANQSPSTSSAVNFQKLTPNLNNANGIVIANCDDFGGFILLGGGSDPLCPQGDLSFKANFSGARLVVDVLGYYTRADVSVVKSTVVEETQTNDVELSDSECHNLTSCGRLVNLGGTTPAGKLLVMGSANFDVSTGTGSNTIFRYLTLTDVDDATCDLDSNDPHTAVLQTTESASGVDKQLNIQGVFPVEANAAKTIHLNTQVFGDLGNVAHANSSSIICTFIPD